MRMLFNLLHDVHDARDFLFAKTFLKSDMPEIVDLRTRCSPIENQETLGSCGPNALAGAMEFNDLKDGNGYTDLSRLFIYYVTRERMGTIKEDSGVSIREMVKAVAKFGACDEMMWPYEINRYEERPHDLCYTDAEHRRIKEYWRVNGATIWHTEKTIMYCLLEGFPIVFGLMLYESFMTDEVAANGYVPVPALGEKSLGGHAMEIVGYDITERQFIVRNSWGKAWGDKGYCYIPFEYLLRSGMDMWTIRK